MNDHHAHDNLDVRDFLASPRHAYHFLDSKAEQAKIVRRVVELLSSGKLSQKRPIVSIQTGPVNHHQNVLFVELHDGVASAVAWVLYRKLTNQTTFSLGEFRNSFPLGVVVLKNRIHQELQQTWHPYVPIECKCANRLEIIQDEGQNHRLTCKALTKSQQPVFFNDENFFSGIDKSETIGTIVEALLENHCLSITNEVTKIIMEYDDLDVRDFLASPRHAYHFLGSKAEQEKIVRRIVELLRTGKISQNRPIVNIQTDTGNHHNNILFVELHNGVASAVAWVLYRKLTNQTTFSLGEFRTSFPLGVVVLKNRINQEKNETWHPYVPIECNCASRLEIFQDGEQNQKLTCKALTKSQQPVYFNDETFFSGIDKSETIGTLVEALLENHCLYITNNAF